MTGFYDIPRDVRHDILLLKYEMEHGGVYGTLCAFIIRGDASMARRYALHRPCLDAFPLALAAKLGDVDLVRDFLELASSRGVSESNIAEDAVKAACEAAGNGRYVTADMSWDECGASDSDPAHKEAQKSYAIMKLLVDRFADDPLFRSSVGLILQMAARRGFYAVAKMLVDQFSDELYYDDTRTLRAVKDAARVGQYSIVKLVYDKFGELFTFWAHAEVFARDADANGHFALAKMLRAVYYR